MVAGKVKISGKVHIDNKYPCMLGGVLVYCMRGRCAYACGVCMYGVRMCVRCAYVVCICVYGVRMWCAYVYIIAITTGVGT